MSRKPHNTTVSAVAAAGLGLVVAALPLVASAPAHAGVLATSQDPTPVVYAVAGTSFVHAAGQPTSTEPARQYLNAGIRVWRYTNTVSVTAQVRGDATKLADAGELRQVYAVGTRVDGACKIAFQQGYSLNETRVNDTWSVGYGQHAKRPESVPFDEGWDCFTLSMRRADQAGHAVGPVIDQIEGTLTSEAAVPRAGGSLTVRRAPNERVIPVRRGRWTAVPLELRMNHPVYQADVTVTGTGRRTKVRTATFATDGHDLRKVWIRARGTKPRQVTLTLTAAGGTPSRVSARVVPQAPTGRLRPGRYESTNRKFRFRVTRDHRVVKLRGKLELDIGGSGYPMQDWYSFRSFALPRHGWQTTVRNLNGGEYWSGDTQGVYLQPLSVRRAYVYLVQLGDYAGHRALRVRRIGN